MASDPGRKRSSKSQRDYYDILGVSRAATDREIKQQYIKLARQYHPDKNPNPEATAQFQEIGKAYKVLGDPKRRSTYDLLGAHAADVIENYEEYPETFNEMSACKKFLFGLFCCLTGCCCCCGCCCICGCFCCCNFCCGHCCSRDEKSTVSPESGDDEIANNSNSQSNRTQQTSSIHQQPKDTVADSAKY